LLSQRVDVDPTPFAVETDMAVDQGIQRVIVAAADIATGVELGANLADQDAASSDTLATEPLDAAALSVAVATVAAAALAFLMCHVSIKLSEGGAVKGGFPESYRKTHS